MPNSNLILSERIHDILRERLVTHQIRPGDHVGQDAIAAEFGMSKIPVREALTRLEANGLVVSTHNKGYLAAPLSVAEVDELFALRLLVEPVTTALAATMATHSDRALLSIRLEAWIAGDDAEVSTLYITRLNTRWAVARQNVAPH